eukprot:TRINITY_DN2904_c0_g1_i4.p1 TRINITY_DN2904_c0_g1~~TRINITY_DN2904_c0_g1_i4.p1  ORF type:complete len:315 (-),score=108.01 TRINITY_DN2904_c0_g1_i4:480-1424(-)
MYVIFFFFFKQKTAYEMLRSLVGSEMCIRDSINAEYGGREDTTMHAQLVMGPAGSGKSTYCEAMQKHGQATGRSLHVVNLDPAAEAFDYEVAIDIRDLITLEDVMEEMKLGPNGGLIFAMEHLIENLDWLEEEVSQYEGSYLLFDCPGQIELYGHVPVMRRLADAIQGWGVKLCGVYLIDSQFISDNNKFLAGTLSALSCMVGLELPHINVLTKCDLVSPDPDHLEKYLEPNLEYFLHELSVQNKTTPDHPFARLNATLIDMMQQWSMVVYVPLNPLEEDSVQLVLSHVDNAIQWGEDQEPKDPDAQNKEGDDY